MKKIISGILSLALIATSALNAVTAEDNATAAKLTDLYASRGNVYLTFDSEPTTGTALTFKDANGADVAYTATVQEGNVLRLTPSVNLNLDEQYRITVGEADKKFKVKTIKAEDFSDNSYAETLDFYKVGATSANQARVGFLDGKLFMQQRYVSYFTLKDGLVNNLKNYTVEFDMEAYQEHMAGIMFNKTNKDGQFRYGKKTEGVDEIGWIFGTSHNWAKCLYRYERTDDAQTEVITGNNSSNYTPITDRIIPSTYKITYDDTTGVIGLDKSTETTLPVSIRYTVDKMGRTGVLSLDGAVKDVYSKATTAETGYFFIGSTNSWNMNNTSDGRGISLDNIIVTTCEVIPELTDVYASPKSIYLTFDGDVFDDLPVEVKDKNDRAVAVTAKACDNKMLRLTPTTELNCDEMYTVIAGEKKFAFTIKQVFAEDFSDGDYTDTLTFVSRSYSKAQIVDGKLYMLQGRLGHFLINEGKVNTLKNYSVEFDMATYQTHREAIVFNKVNHGQYDGFHYSGENDAYHGWVFESAVNKTANNLYRTYLLSDKTAWYGEAAVSGTTVIPSTQKLTWNDETSTMGFAETATEESQKVAPTAVTYAVDKMGKTGVLSMDGIFKDTYTHEASNEAGYFYIGSAYTGGSNGSGFSLDNIRVTTCTSKEILPDPNLTQLYASTKNVYLTFDGAPTTDIDVKFTDLEGGAVTFTKAVQDGNVLRLTPNTALTIGKFYEIEVGTVKKIFRVVEVLKEDFSDGEYTDTLKFVDRATAKAQIVDGKLYMLQGGLGHFLIQEGKVDTLKNYSVEFDMATYQTHREAIVFNKVNHGQFDGFHWSGTGDAYHGWVFESAVNTTANNLYRTYLLSDKTAWYGEAAVSGTTVIPSTQKLTWNDETSTMGFAETATEESQKVAPTAVTYAVDKMGKTGVLSMNGIFKDAYTHEASNETGYFYIGSAYPGGSDGSGFSLDNLLVTTCEECVSNVFVTEATAKDKDGNTIETVSGNDTITGTVKVANMYSQDKLAVVVVAAFKGDTMINSTIAKAKEETMVAGRVMTANYTLTGVSTADNLRVFVWDSLQNMKPLAQRYIFAETGI